MEDVLVRLRGPWPWWVVGPLVGAMVPLCLLLLNRHFGLSSSLRHICAAAAPGKPPYLRYDWRKERWSLAMVLGLVLGGWIAARFLAPDPTPQLSAGARALFASWGLGEAQGYLPAALFSTRALLEPGNLLLIAGGGFLVGFGARWANGCTSGHAIMGMSLRSKASLLATLAFFAGGLLGSWLLLPLVLR